MNYTYLKNEHVDEVASILLAKYKNARDKLPLLCDKYENYEKLKELISRYVFNEEFVVGIEDGKIAGFMYGIYMDNYKGTAKGVLVLPSLHAVNDGFDKKRVDILLYKKLSEIWAEKGAYTHSILLYVNEEELIDTWVYNGFGYYVIDAVRSLEKIVVPNNNNDITYRQATERDLYKMIELFIGINEHLRKAPIFLHVNGDNDYLDKYSKWLKIENNNLWIAERNDEIIGYLKTNTSEINQPELDDGYTMAITGAYVKKDYRGNNIMAHLVNLSLEWAKENQLKRCSTDFETANYEGRSFWLKHFIPYSYALIRRIDERNNLNREE